LAVAAIDAEVVSSRNAPSEIPLDLLNAAPAVTFEQLSASSGTGARRMVPTQDPLPALRYGDDYHPGSSDSYPLVLLDGGRITPGFTATSMGSFQRFHP
jgi:hypothetical protein